MPHAAAPAPTTRRLDRRTADEVGRRLDRLDDLLAEYAAGRGPAFAAAFGPTAVDLLEIVAVTVLPEDFAEPPLDATPTRHAPGTEAKADVMYGRSLCQRALWNDADPETRTKYWGLLAVLRGTDEDRKRWRRKAAASGAPSAERRRRPKARRNHHDGMLRFDGEDVAEFTAEVARACGRPQGRQYNPAEHRKRGCETDDRAGKKVAG